MENCLTMTNIAQNIIEKCGGIRATAAICGRTENWVRKWTYPKNRNGRGGVVPHEDAVRLLAAASDGRVDLTPSDFFPTPDEELPTADR